MGFRSFGLSSLGFLGGLGDAFFLAFLVGAEEKFFKHGRDRQGLFRVGRGVAGAFMQAIGVEREAFCDFSPPRAFVFLGGEQLSQDMGVAQGVFGVF